MSDEEKSLNAYRSVQGEMITQLTMRLITLGKAVPPSLTKDAALADMAAAILDGENPAGQFDAELSAARSEASNAHPNHVAEIEAAAVSIEKLLYGR